MNRTPAAWIITRPATPWAVARGRPEPTRELVWVPSQYDRENAVCTPLFHGQLNTDVSVECIDK